jgi:hypothetical protein
MSLQSHSTDFSGTHLFVALPFIQIHACSRSVEGRLVFSLLGSHSDTISKDGAQQQGLRRNSATILSFPRFMGKGTVLTSWNIVSRCVGVLA